MPKLKKITETKAELMVKINNKQAEIDYLNEQLFDAGIKTRPTMMTKIISREKQAADTIKYIISECEKETGRTFDICSLCSSNFI